MDIDKVNWNNSQDRLNIAFPIAKINKEKRTVSGFASLDNVDRHGDIVTSDASEKAFSRFRGNLREMHQPIAVGKVVQFTPQDFIDPESGNSYKGIYVDAYISKGAQDTWEKVCDGTLTGFSIGGNIVDADQDATNNDIRVIKDYQLMELSLVDNPANPLANIFSIQKNADGAMSMTGIATGVNIENIFWCKNDQIAVSSTYDEKNCVVCGDSMSTIGWVESNDTNKSAVIKKLVQGQFVKDDAPGPDHAATTMDGDAGVINTQSTINLYPDQNKVKKSNTVVTIEKTYSNLLSKGGNEEMAEEVIEKAASVDEAPESAPVDDTVFEKAVDSENDLEKAADVSELPGEDLDLVKMVEKTVKKSIKKNYGETAATVADMYAAVQDVQKSIGDYGSKTTELTNNVSDVVKSIGELAKSIGDLSASTSDLAKRVDALEGSTALKKSADAAPVSAGSTKITKGGWDGRFLSQDLFN